VSVIAHWLMYAARPVGSEPVVTTDAAMADEYRGYGWRVEGPFVPADQLTVALAALDRIAGIWEPESRAIAREALDAIRGGGQ
jgi:hypothetical protein